MKLHVSHILVTYQYEAEDLLKKLKEGASFAELAMKYSLCPSGKQGGDLGPLDSRRLDEDFAEAASQLKMGDTSPIVRTRFGYHLIQKMSD
ncbi:peptidyl-prolyl cis-trans isomerase [bacterium]|nr:peptidyl-prolyl cis-trans isomerase [bacterium]